MIAGRAAFVRPVTAAPARLQGLWAIVLAAGGARRFGRNKLLLRVGGESLLARATRQATRLVGSRCIVVLGADASQLAGELTGHPVRVVVNRHWRSGMAGSLQAGVLALPASARAALVVLADQYAVGADDLLRLALAWARRPQSAAAALVNALPGAPAVLPRSLFAAVLDLQGDRGARHLLRATGRSVSGVEMSAAGYDLDAHHDLPLFRRLGRRIR
jgi:molybdenum cofactor cytidylyltransferase